MHVGQSTTRCVSATGPIPNRLPEGTANLSAFYG